jgi:hypothetical protein
MTAEEILSKHRVWYNDEKSRRCREAMIEFAQYHVEEALKIASEKAEIDEIWENPVNPSFGIKDRIVDKDSILNAYPKENLK